MAVMFYCMDCEKPYLGSTTNTFFTNIAKIPEMPITIHTKCPDCGKISSSNVITYKGYFDYTELAIKNPSIGRVREFTRQAGRFFVESILKKKE